MWLLPWSFFATLFALRFNEPTALFGGMPGRVWGALVLAWSWLALMPLWFHSGYQAWLGAVALLSAPAGALIALLLLPHDHLIRRRQRETERLTWRGSSAK